MKSLRTIFRYISKYPKLIFAYFSFNILSSIFAVVSLGLISPFLFLIFKMQDTLSEVSNSSGFFARINPINRLNAVLSDVIRSPNGEVKALAIICFTLLAAFLLKNLLHLLFH